MGIAAAEVKQLAHRCGFELAGIAAAVPNADVSRYLDWASRGLAGRMSYLADRRAAVREDPRNLLSSARSIVCVGKLYNTPEPHSAGISRYAWGDDYHSILRQGLESLAASINALAPCEYKICVDTAPLLERSYARDAGLGWIGKNTCLINQYSGSWFFLGELLVSLDLEPDAAPEPRCGTCTRCIDACPTQAIVEAENGYELDARLCISYLTIELKGPIPEELQTGIGTHVFGCDICQDVCPWNARASMTLDNHFYPRDHAALPLERMAELSEQEFREMFRDSPVSRAKHAGFLRNVALAMTNAREDRYREPLERLALRNLHRGTM